MTWKTADFLKQKGPIDGLNLSNVDHTSFWHTAIPFFQANITGERLVPEIRSNGDDHHCIQAACVKPIVLQHKRRFAIPEL